MCYAFTVADILAISVEAIVGVHDFPFDVSWGIWTEQSSGTLLVSVLLVSG
jgi:hypothetical protein